MRAFANSLATCCEAHTTRKGRPFLTQWFGTAVVGAWVQHGAGGVAVAAAAAVVVVAAAVVMERQDLEAEIGREAVASWGCRSHSHLAGGLSLPGLVDALVDHTFVVRQRNKLRICLNARTVPLSPEPTLRRN